MRRDDQPGVLDLMEEGAHLLRRAPLSAWAAYVFSTAPFVLALLYFWADMARSPLAAGHVEVASLGLALLYVAMRTGQARFCARLRALASGGAEPALGRAALLRLALAQAVLAPLGLLALLVSAIIVLPFGWVYAFHQHLCAGADAGPADLRDQARRAVADARPWAMQNHAFLGLAWVLRIAVYLNVVTFLALVPALVKMFTGVESDFTRTYWWVFSTPFQAACCALTYLATDPLVKAFYTLRAWYAGARATGEDLLAALPARAALVLLAAAGLFVAPRAEAKPSAAPAAVVAARAPGMSPGQLDPVIDRVQQRTEFLWRMPREFIPQKREEDKNFLERFFDGLQLYLHRAWDHVRETWRRLADWIAEKSRFGRGNEPATKARSPSGLHWGGTLQALSWLVLAVFAAALAVLAYRLWRTRAPRAVVAAAAPAAPPDLEQEDVLATELPEDEWLGLADRLLGEGDPRRALRAVFLATLALLARAELVAVKRWKSNREYARELSRQACRRPVAPPLFDANMRLFERTWYGLHPAAVEAVREARDNWGRLKAHVEA